MRKRDLLLLAFAFCFAAFSVQAQSNTVGVIELDEFSASPGDKVIYPAPQSNVYLIDNCGRVCHTWTDSTNFRPGNTVYLLEDGNILKTKRDMTTSDDPIWAGGGGEFVEIRDWDNNLLWQLEINDSLERMHHDAMPMPNGNVMMIVWENIDSASAIAAGRDPSLMSDGEVWPDYLLEVTPIYPDSYTVAWEWHAWDHLIQDFDSTKANYGDPALNPGKIDLNHVGVEGPGPDWLHFNAIDYNQNLDQVVISNPEFNEIWIIDHSTTTAQAAGSTGGSAGRGGDLIYRWGNPMTYGHGDSTDIQLHYQHNPNWIDDFVPSSVNDFGKIILFNNRIPSASLGNYSSVDIIAPVFNDYDWRYETASDGTYLPSSPDWKYTTPDSLLMYSNILSSGQRLANGNTLIGVGRPGLGIEVDAAGDVVWHFKNPLQAAGPASQGDTLPQSTNMMFRVKRFPMDYAAFSGRDLTPGAILEMNADSTFCVALDVGTPEPASEIEAVYPNPAFDRITIDRSIAKPALAELFNLHGQVMRSQEIRGYRARMDVNGLTPGIYFLRVDRKGAIKIVVNN